VLTVSFENKELVSRWTLPPEPRHRCRNFTTSILNGPVTLAYLIGESGLFRRNKGASWLFITVHSYLLTDQFLVDRYLWQFCGISKPRGGKIFITRPRML